MSSWMKTLSVAGVLTIAAGSAALVACTVTSSNGPIDPGDGGSKNDSSTGSDTGTGTETSTPTDGGGDAGCIVQNPTFGAAACTTCMNTNCATPVQACFRDSTCKCQELDDCASACITDAGTLDPTCFDACKTAAGATATQAYDAVLDCLFAQCTNDAGTGPCD